jgi:hypothetical protein
MGSVVASNWTEYTDRGSNRLSVVTCVNLSCHKPSFGNKEKALFLFKLTSAFASEKHSSAYV